MVDRYNAVSIISIVNILSWAQVWRQEGPMNDVTRKLALRAAAKVALASALFACGSTAMPEAEEESETSSEGYRRRCDQGDCRISSVTQPSKADVGCCDAFVGRAITTGNKTIDTAQELACCKVLIHDSDRAANQDGTWGALEGEKRGACCAAVYWDKNDWNTGPTCTPWGPPTPPPMDWVA
jgi:hypothetical protein